ncbi:hypothetical protein [Chitinivibrio alkaliphilus]|uniref:DUF4878 domain-containing protein n=1 Tax=Chitinivibrio alkaliphilus ACht1 TaxID=1313304 RepID=U7DBT4_9BACT|nr:hypothetical protein [Chitinivibrio alkaliphilus]ERP31865.1 hypothetical protein CALK_1079 [Chitinivibrio alkaliphilus ACht1]
MKLCMALVFSCMFLFVACTESTDVDTSTPTGSFNQLLRSLEEGEYGEVFDAYSEKSQEEMSEIFEMMVQMSAMMEEDDENAELFESLEGKDGREIFITLMSQGTPEENAASFIQGEVISEEVDEDSAVLAVAGDDGETHNVTMVLEGDTWKIENVQ